MDASHSPTSPNLPGGLDTASTPATEDLRQFDDAQLREIYENEEIERFLGLFSTYVNEVKAPEYIDKQSGSSPPVETEGEWTSEESGTSVIKDQGPQYECLSEEVAYRFLLPLLPPPKNPPQEFTLNRFKLASQRVYLAIVPYYFPFLRNFYRLAKWQDKQKSSFFCAVFWVLWGLDLLPAAFFFSLILILLKHRFLPYPSRSQLRKHRDEISYADSFSEQLSHRLSSPSVFGAQDIWRFGRLFMFPQKRIVKMKAHPRMQAYLNGEEANEPTILEGTSDSDEVQDMKRLGLFLMNETADLHERIKNVFIWRKPFSSWTYLGLISVLFLGSLLIPAKYVFKAVSGSLGFVFWHLVPIILALSPEERLRLPPPMLDVPTDADYAMELISQRVAAGLEIRPSRLSKGKPATPEALHTQSSSIVGEHIDAKIRRPKVMSGYVKGMDKALDSGKSLLQGGKQFIKAQAGQTEDDAPSFSNLINPLPTSYTYPAQHSTAPGLITLTPTTFYFSPITSSRDRLTISLEDIKGLKKTGILKGLEIVWSVLAMDGHQYDKIEKFRWINNRDELFARLISANSGMKWMNIK